MKINKKRKLKNYFKLGLLLIGIPFTLINCEKDIEIIDLTESNQQVFDPIKNLTLDEALNDIEFSQISISLNLTKKNLTHKNGQDDVIYIDTKNIIKIIKKDYITYTFLIINKKQENKNSFTNLIVEKSTNKTRGYLANYLPTNEYLNKKAKGIKTPFQGTVSFSPFTEDLTALLNTLNKKINNTSKNNLQSKISDCYYQTVTIETSCASGQHWPGDNCTLTGSSRASSRFVEALVCDESGGGGSGIIYENPPIFIGENENIGISSGGDGSSYIPPSGSTYPNLPAELTDSIDPINDFVFPDKIIIDPTVSDCVKNIIKLLQLKDNHFSVVPSISDQPISHISQAILDLFDSSTQYSLEFSVEQLGTRNGNEINGETTKLAPDFTSWGIKIDSDLASNGTQLFIAKTIIHESVHAIMGYSLKEYRTSDFALDLQELYNTKGKNQNLTEHEFMSQYVEAFAYSLAAWDNHRQTMDYYKMLSWGGLETSSAYEKLNNKIEIQNAIQNERYNKNDAKGTKCN